MQLGARGEEGILFGADVALRGNELFDIGTRSVEYRRKVRRSHLDALSLRS